MKDNEEKLMENQAEKESCKELSDEKLSEDVLEDVSAGAIDSGAKYINIRPSMKTEIYGNVMSLLKENDPSPSLADINEEYRPMLVLDKPGGLPDFQESTPKVPKPTLVGPDFNFGK